MKANKKLEKLLEDAFDERIGQYKTKVKASQEAKRLTRSTGAKHIPLCTIAYRIMNDYSVAEFPCWTVIITRPIRYY